MCTNSLSYVLISGLVSCPSFLTPPCQLGIWQACKVSGKHFRNWKDGMPAPPHCLHFHSSNFSQDSVEGKLRSCWASSPVPCPNSTEALYPKVSAHSRNKLPACVRLPHGKENACVQQLPLPPEVLTAVNSMQYIENEEWPE